MKIFIAVFLALMVSQFLKFLKYYTDYKKFNFETLFWDGGFSSSHSAFVSALTLSVFIEQGFSILLAVVLVFSLIVIHDSMRLRRQAGIQAHIINEVMKIDKIHHKKLVEHVGHTPEQTFKGILVGFIVTVIIYLI